jgi:glycosyltransferase involved in cell wall biosynthesis
MNKVAIVVQRCHPDVVGGSETLAWHYATLLRDAYDVEVLTTTAVDTTEWANTLSAGPESKDGVTINRFPVTIGRSVYWSGLHRRLIEAFGSFTPGRANDGAMPELGWTIALQEEFIRHQGPYSEPLLQFIRSNWRDYRAIFFITYLYPTAYFGIQQLPAGKALFVPTLHDELPAYLPAYKYTARRAREIVWLTAAEQRVGRKLWGDLPGRVVAMAIDTEPREPKWSPAPYLLYCGRVDPNKGCRELFEYFITYKKTHPGNLRLIITGIADIPVPDHAEIEFRGFVSAEEKFRLMAGASVFVTPSPNESFSIVTLEAMAQNTPVLVNGASEVLADHAHDSGAGRAYTDYDSFARGLNEMLSTEELRSRMGQRGRDYVASRYTTQRVRESLMGAVEARAVEPVNF